MHYQFNHDKRYPIDVTIMREMERDKVREARECHHEALRFRRLGCPTIAAWEDSMARQYIREARVAKACID